MKDEKKIALLLSLIICLAGSACDNPPDSIIRTGDTVKVLVMAGMNPRGGLIVNPPPADAQAYLQEQGCVYDYYELDSLATQVLQEVGGLETTSGSPVIFVNRIYQCP